MTDAATMAKPSAAGTSDVLSVRNVSAAYGPYRALFDVSFRVPAEGLSPWSVPMVRASPPSLARSPAW